MDVADWAAVGSVIVAAAGLFFAAWELRERRRQETALLKAEVDGVSVMWWPKLKPTPEHEAAGEPWQFQIEIHNPGRFPIRDVVARLKFPFDVRRRHYSNEFDDSTDELELRLSVLSAGKTFTKTRTVRMKPGSRSLLHNTIADVSFTDWSGNRHSRSGESA